MGQTASGTFETIWRQAVTVNLSSSGLPAREVDRLSQLGAQLGVMDLELQLRVLSLYQEQLSLNMEEVRQEMRTKIRLCHCLGVMGGLLVAVLLL